MRLLGMSLAGLFVIVFLMPCRLLAQEGETDIEAVSLESLLDVRVRAAAKYEQTAREAPASVTVVTAEEIERYGYRTLTDALEHVRGFYIDNDLENEYAGVRGFGQGQDQNNRTLILLNGHTLNEAATGATFADRLLGLDLDVVERIEVVRGPGSALYGTGALFAVINIITKDTHGQGGLEVAGAAGSLGRQEAEVRWGTHLGEVVEVLFSGFWGDRDGQDLYFKEYDAPATNNGVAEKQDWRRYRGAFLRAAYKGLSVQGRLNHYETGRPTGVSGTAFNHDTSRIGYLMGFFTLQYERDLASDKRVLVKAHYNPSERETDLPYPQAQGVFVRSDEGISKDWGGEAQFQWDTSPGNRVIVGAEYKEANLGYEAWSGPQVLGGRALSFRFFSAYVQDELRLSPHLALTLGLRHDRYSHIGGATTPRGALVYSFSPASTIKLLLGGAYRAPGVVELFWENEQINLVENPDLKPERMRTLETVWEHAWSPGFVSTVSVYDYRLRDLIELAFDPERNVLQYSNVGKVKAQGVEMGVDTQLGEKVHGYASYAFQHARDARTGDELVSSPAHLVKGGAWFRLFAPVFVAPQVRYESSRRTVYGTRTDPFVMTDVTVTTRPLLAHLRLALRVRNVFDVTYKLPGGPEHRQHALIQEGRTVGLLVTFGL